MDTICVPVDELLESENKEPIVLQEKTNEILDETASLDLSTPNAARTFDVQFTDVEPIEVNQIVDKHGRLSDIIEALEEKTGLSVIPLSMANIAPEVTELQRHEIFEFGGERYAFSHRIRRNVVDEYVEAITANISSGIPFALELVTSVVEHDNTYKTLLLSRDEWTYVLSKCRNFKQSLIANDDETQITMTIMAERV